MNFDRYLEPPDEPDPILADCEDCDGTGNATNEDFNPDYECDCEDFKCECVERLRMVACSACDGEGQREQEPCSTCDSLPCRCDADYDAWRDSRLEDPRDD